MAREFAPTTALLALLCLAGSVAVAPVLAQAPAAAVDPAFEVARKAFEAWPETTRRDVQDALVWTNDYKGTVDGNFGRGTRAAIAAWAGRAKLPTDGALDDKARENLLAEARKARAAAQFGSVTDNRSGVSIGLPRQVLAKRVDLPNGSRWSSADGAVTLEVTQTPESAGNLAALYATLTADQPGRKLTYKVLRPDFLVTSGDLSGRTFYTRIARGDVAGQPVLRGYTLAYPATMRNFEAISIAVANAFAPFATAAPATPPAQQQAAIGQQQTAAPVAQPATPAQPPTPPRQVFGGTALALGNGQYVTVLGEKGCASPQIAARPAQIGKRDAATGLTVIQSSGDVKPPAFVPWADAAGPFVSLFETPLIGVAAPASGLPRVEVQAASAEPQAVAGDKTLRIVAALQGAAGGALVLDRAGHIAGLVAPAGAGARVVAGVMPQAVYRVIDAADVMTFLGIPAPVRGAGATAPLSTGQIVTNVRAAITPLFCTL